MKSSLADRETYTVPATWGITSCSIRRMARNTPPFFYVTPCNLSPYQGVKWANVGYPASLASGMDRAGTTYDNFRGGTLTLSLSGLLLEEPGGGPSNRS